MSPTMAKMKKHKNVEIAAKLAQAADLAAQGKVQSEIARILGVSVMTLHRWRKLAPTIETPTLATSPPIQSGLEHNHYDPNRAESKNKYEPMQDERIGELQLENSRLRRLLTDLLLEKMQLQERLQAEVPAGRRQTWCKAI
jgi:putative transposase